MVNTVNIKKAYKEKIKPELAKEFGDLNIHEVPELKKIVLNTGIGKIVSKRKLSSTSQQTDEEMLSDFMNEFSLITVQKPQLIRSNKSIAGFKLREGSVVGLKVTLRNKKMYEFLARFIHVALPRTRDFRGISLNSIDGSGNLTIGVKESSIFPEIPSTNFIWGLEVTLVTDKNDREKAIELFKKLGIPFKKEK